MFHFYDLLLIPAHSAMVECEMQCMKSEVCDMWSVNATICNLYATETVHISSEGLTDISIIGIYIL